MRVFKRLTALALILFLLVSICGCGFNTKENKIISMGVDEPPVNIDPQLASSESELIIARNTMTGLFRIFSDGSAEKSLCDNYTVSDDGLSYEFKIKSAKWSNGDDITADDFVFGIIRALSPETKSPGASTLFCIKNAESYNLGQCDQSQLGISATDGVTVKIVLEKAVSDIEYRLADVAAMPCNRAFFTECKGKYGLSNKNMIYCGPFYVSSWTDKSIKMSRFSGYAGGNVKPASLTMTFGETSDEKISSISKGVIDIAVIDSEKELSAKDAGLKTMSVKNISWAIIINPNDSVAGTELCSSALKKSLDRTAIESALPSGYSMFSGIIAPDLNVCGKKYGEYINDYEQPSINVTEAKQEYMQAIKDSSGSLNGATLLYVDSGQMSSLAVKIAASWQSNLDAYINTEGVSLEEMKKRMAAGSYTVALYPIGTGLCNADDALSQFETGNSGNVFGISDDEFDSLMTNSENAVNAADRAATLSTAENRLIADGYVYPLFLTPTVVAVTPSMSGCIFDLFRGNFDFSQTGK